MKKLGVVMLALLMLAALTGTASAKALGYGIVFGGPAYERFGGGVPGAGAYKDPGNNRY